MDSAGNSSSMQSSSGGGGGDVEEYDDPREDQAVSFSAAAASSFLNTTTGSVANLFTMGSHYPHSGLLHQQQQQQQQQPLQNQQQLPSSFLDYSFFQQRYAAAEQAFQFAPAAPRPSSTTQAHPSSSSSGAGVPSFLSPAGAEQVPWGAMANRLSTPDHSLTGLMGLPTTTQRQLLQQQQSTLLAADPAGGGGGGPGNYPGNQTETTSSGSAVAANPPPPSTPTSQQPPQQQQTTQAVSGGAAPAPAGAQPPARASKKRPRASRRAPTTVLTTDTANFRQMVQKFTGIPLQPFGPSGSLMLPTRPSLTRMDMFGSNATGRPSASLFPGDASSASFLLRPFPQKAAAVPFPYGGSPSTAVPSPAGGLASSLLAPPSIVPPTSSGATGSSPSSSAMTVLPSSPSRMMIAPSTTSDPNTNPASTSPAASYGLLPPRDHVGGGASSSGGSQIGQRPLAPPQNPGFTFQSLLQQQPYRYYPQPSPQPSSQQIQRAASMMREMEFGASQSAGAGGDMLATEWAARLQASSSSTNTDGIVTTDSRRASDPNPRGRPDMLGLPPGNPPSTSQSLSSSSSAAAVAAAAAAATTRAADDLFSWIGSD